MDLKDGNGNLEKKRNNSVLSPESTQKRAISKTKSSSRSRSSSASRTVLTDSDEFRRFSREQTCCCRCCKHCYHCCKHRCIRDRNPSHTYNSTRYSKDEPLPSHTLGVFGLNSSTDEYELEKQFEKYGEIIDLKLIFDRRTNQSKGYAFIKFRRLDQASLAKNKMNGKYVDNRLIRVDYSLTHERYPSRKRNRSP